VFFLFRGTFNTLITKISRCRGRRTILLFVRHSFHSFRNQGQHLPSNYVKESQRKRFPLTLNPHWLKLVAIGATSQRVS